MDETYPSGNLIKFIPLIEEVFILKVTYVGKKIQKLGKSIVLEYGDDLEIDKSQICYPELIWPGKKVEVKKGLEYFVVSLRELRGIERANIGRHYSEGDRLRIGEWVYYRNCLYIVKKISNDTIDITIPFRKSISVRYQDVRFCIQEPNVIEKILSIIFGI